MTASFELKITQGFTLSDSFSKSANQQQSYSPGSSTSFFQRENRKFQYAFPSL